MNMFKSNGGFTLVELIVVIAILAILAGVAIPAYSGYIEKANNTAVLAELEAAETAAFAACAMEGTTPDKIVVTKAGAVEIYDDVTAEGAATKTYQKSSITVADFFEGTVSTTAMAKYEDYKDCGFEWVGGTWTVAADETYTN